MEQTQLLEFIVKSLVDNPEAVSIAEKETPQGTVLELSVTQEDIGKIIGRQGRTARAIRTLLGAVSARTHTRVLMEIAE